MDEFITFEDTLPTRKRMRELEAEHQEIRARMELPRGRHLKVTWADEWYKNGEYESYARGLFDFSKKVLVVREKDSSKSKKAHVHMQGYQKGTEKEFEKVVQEMKTKHPEVIYAKEKRPDYHPRPVTEKQAEVNEKGFQYIMKEKQVPIVANLFTEDELNALHKASTEHVQEVKCRVKDVYVEYIKENPPPPFVSEERAKAWLKSTQIAVMRRLKDKEEGYKVTQRYWGDDFCNAVIDRTTDPILESVVMDRFCRF